MGTTIELARFEVKAGAEDRLVAGRAAMIQALHAGAAWFDHIAASGGLRHVEVVDAWSA